MKISNNQRNVLIGKRTGQTTVDQRTRVREQQHPVT